MLFVLVYAKVLYVFSEKLQRFVRHIVRILPKTCSEIWAKTTALVIFAGTANGNIPFKDT